MSPLEALAAFHWLCPLWLLALPLALLPWLRRRASGQDSPWAGRVDPELLPYLLVDQPGAGFDRAAPALALSLGILLGVLALAGPAFRLLPQVEASREAGLVVALDLSEGMLAADVAPDRLGRARFEIADLLRARGDGQVALIAYAGDAHTVTPLTDDAATVEALLGALAPEIMPAAGQRPQRALQLAESLIEGAGLAGGEVLLVSYAGGSAAEAEAARLAARGIRTSLLLLGTDAGAPLPQPGGGFRSDDSGRVLLAPRDLPGASALATAGGGIALAASVDTRDTERLLALWERRGDEIDERQQAGSLRYVDEGPWLALTALLPLLWWLRGRPRAAPPLFLLLLLAGHGAPAEASDSLWERFWSRDDQRAWQALQQGDPARARELAEDAQLAAAAAYRQGDFDVAAEGFGRRQDAVGLYNRGTALARAGALEEALQALDAALALDPGMADAQHNRDVVADALRAQPPQSSPPPSSAQGEQEPSDDDDSEQGEPSEPSDDQGEASSDSSADEGEQGSEAPPKAETEAEQSRRQQLDQAQREAIEQALAESGQSAGEARSEAASPSELEREQRQASEQLLRRIHDDPGALLRRKFALEQRRRALEGEQP